MAIDAAQCMWLACSTKNLEIGDNDLWIFFMFRLLPYNRFGDMKIKRNSSMFFLENPLRY